MKLIIRMLIALCLIAGIHNTGLAQEQAAERILYYNSDILVNKDSSMVVMETIKVVSAGIQIIHGIYRDFPTQYRDQSGNRYTVAFDVMDVRKNGQPEPYFLSNLENGVRVYIGDANTVLSPGEYTYTLKYRTDRQLGFFEDHDELYWNVTGTGWDFAIDKASATVTLPEGVDPASVALEGYTGPQGAKGKDFKSHINDYGKAVFETTAPLNPHEGLTIVVSWPKGFVEEPTQQEKLTYFFQDNSMIFIGLLGLFIILVYYIFVWSLVGNDPNKGTIVVQYDPPDGMSPAAVRFLRRMGYDHKAFAVALIDMAVKGFVKIKEERGVYTVEKDRAEREKLLSPEEDRIADVLLGSEESIELVNTHHAKIGEAVKAVKAQLQDRYDQSYFSTNSKYIIPGIILTIGTLILALLSRPTEKAAIAGFMTVWLSIWSIGVFFLVSQVVSGWRRASLRTISDVASTGNTGCMTIFAIPFIVGELFGIGFLVYSTSPLFVLMLLVLISMNILFYHLLKAPTVMGRQLLDKIEGFRVYLSTAEADYMNTIYPREKTPELFEKYLPYALALDVAQQWAQQFADVITRAGETYTPGWYSGAGWNTLGAAGFASSLGSSFSGAVASSSTAPGSSSGSGGGGSSGGGGGGGGGGGW